MELGQLSIFSETFWYKGIPDQNKSKKTYFPDTQHNQLRLMNGHIESSVIFNANKVISPVDRYPFRHAIHDFYPPPQGQR